MIRAGLPATVAPSGTSLVTTLPAPTSAFSPMVMPHSKTAPEPMEAPRFTKGAPGGCEVQIESRVSAATREELTRRGHKLSVVGEYSGYMGGGQAVMHDAVAKVNYGASSPRKDGAAIPEPDPYFD